MNNNKENSYITLSDLWEIFMANIWLFAISIAVSLSVAVAYIIVTPQSYTRSASVLVKDDNSGSGFSGSDMLTNMGLADNKSYIDDEIHVFKTPRLMTEVVERLSLDYIYKVKYRGLRWVDIYNAAPFRVVVDDSLEHSTMSFEIQFDGAGGYKLTGLVVDGEELGSTVSGKFGQKVATPKGSFVVEYALAAEIEVSNSLYSFSKTSIDALAVAYANNLSALFRSEEASIIVLSITMGSKEKAEDILNTLIEVYSENWVKDKNMINVSTTEFIDERLRILEEELGEVDKIISAYKSQNLLPDLGVVAGINLATSSENAKRQVELNNQLSMARYIKEYIAKNGSKDKLLPANAGIESASINAQIASYNDLLMQKNTLLLNSSDENPIVADMTNSLDAMKSLLTISIDDLISTLELQLKNAKIEEKGNKAKISNNPSQELFLLSSSREQKVKEQLYLYLLQKREENELSQTFTAYNTKVLDWARGSNAPIAPQRNVILLFALAIGCILPIIFLILKESLNTTVNNREDLSSTSVPFIGSIPAIENKEKLMFGKKDKNPNNDIHIINDDRSIVSEAFRVARTNLDFMSNKSQTCKLYNITSFNPHSGKSFISLNLALCMAMKNSRTLVIDSDFRRGSLSKATVKKVKVGAVNYINGSKDNIDEIICRAQHHPMLDILPMGIMPPNPTELLLNPRFEQLIELLKARYEYIFFDCPPIEIVPDASIVEKYCDCTIFVARAGLMDKRLVPELEELYTSKRMKNMCLILNNVKHGSSKYGYGRYGYGRYGYGRYGYGRYGYGSYGYGTHETNDEK